jgi:hypothetical protein
MIVGPRQCDFDAFLKLVCEKIVCYLAVLYVLCHVWMERKLASSIWKSFSEIHFGSLFENNMLLFVTLVCDSGPNDAIS